MEEDMASTTHSAPWRVRLARLWNIQMLRLVTQAGFALFILYTLVIHVLVGEEGSIVTTSAEAYCPFGGIETLYTFISSGGTYVSHTHLSNLVILASVLLLTVVARGAFCGWICPLGAIQEWLYAGSAWVQKRIPPLGRSVRALKARAGVQSVRRFDQRGAPTLIERIDHWLRYGKYVVLAWAVLGAVAYGYMVFRDYDPWAALLTITELELTGGVVVLAVVLVASLFVERPWCRYACPLGAAIGLAGKLSPLRIQRDGPACAGCALCNKACPVGIPVDTRAAITDASCIMCMRCVDTCPKHGALELRLTIPGLAPQRPAREQEAGVR
jgi:polyferredoxin